MTPFSVEKATRLGCSQNLCQWGNATGSFRVDWRNVAAAVWTTGLDGLVSRRQNRIRN